MQEQSSTVNVNQQEYSPNQFDEAHSVDVQQSPEVLNFRPEPEKRNSKRTVKISSMSSIKSKGELIKVTKNQDGRCKKNCNNQNESENQKIKKKQCRICLQDEAQGRIIKPCKCTGTMQFVHQTCLCEWIKRKIDYRTRFKVRCQVCDQPFDYKIAKRLSLNCEYLKLNYQRFKSTYRCFFITMSILLTIWIGLIIMIGIGITQSQQGFLKKNLFSVDQAKIIFICIVFVYLLIMGFVTLLFIAEYGVKTELIVKGAQNYTKKNRRVVPKIYSILT